jgi:hypothetical protein
VLRARAPPGPPVGPRRHPGGGADGLVVGARGRDGVGLPALAFRIYNGGSSLPDIPLVVPAEVPALLVGLPVMAAELTALVNLCGRRSGDAEPVPMDGGLAW